MTGEYWRMWRVTSDGELISPFSALSADKRFREPWPVGEPMHAWCDEHEQPPADGCECGIRGMTGGPRMGPVRVLASAAMAGWLDMTTFTLPRHLLLRVCLAVGRVQLGGHITGPSPNDPAPTVRAEHGQPYGFLYVAGATVKADRELKRRYGQPVRDLSMLVMALRMGLPPW